MTGKKNQNQGTTPGQARWGQHFLVNRHLAGQMVQRFLPVDGPILEIGPGLGILTAGLVEQAPANAIKVVEVDLTLCQRLKEKFADKIEIVNGDILDLRLDEKVNLVSNVPYYISRELLDWVLGHHDKVAKGMFMMQKEFVDKLLLGASAQSLIFTGLFRVEKVFEVQPGSFAPPPRVKSTVFLFEHDLSFWGTEVKIDTYYRFLQRCFQNRRKTLFNNLIASFDKKRVKDLLDGLALNPTVRAEQLKPEIFLKIYQNLYRDGKKSKDL